MISKFPGSCKGCNQAYGEGIEIYWTKENGGWHWQCWESRKPGPEAFRLAYELGFIEHDRAVCANWQMLLLSQRFGDRSAQSVRSDDAACGEQDSLFRVQDTTQELK